MKKKLLLVNTQQFGYHLDTYYYCKYLRDIYNITYICWDYNKPKIELDNVKVIYAERKGSSIRRTIDFINKVNCYAKNFDIFFIVYFKGVSILKLIMPKSNNIVLDIRTGSINSKRLKRFIFDSRLCFECFFFPKISIISEGLRKKLNIPSSKCSILPLGADIISSSYSSEYDTLRLLYVGTLSNRNIDVTIKGIAKVLKANPSVKIQYRIIGDGHNNEKAQLEKLISEIKISGVVSCLGFVHHQDIKEHFDWANIGISYIPITSYYDYQPPTKTFEYLLSGIPTIATATTENKRVINKSNGVLINDTIEGFSAGILEIIKSCNSYENSKIVSDAQKFTWVSIIKKLEKIIEG